ncbi:hypothetical protein P3X46_028913 [Hevea brasiliensis]|uniref:M-phase phosphoprotein 6 n=1 Tax=Hevea brasiliensis TaxID=3981 RepID=A0ABQ9KS18_HEVBR|nr:uncharacterized protein LOC110645118 [Hevea brasiliensis]KAJ9146677.1 hypothetical protein P3X46_028913 [Hevea brasiliensis]
MAKREISSTLKNLKFMQRAAQREEKTKKQEEEKPDGSFFSPGIIRKCVVIMEGDPHPGAAMGRMSFQSFNPSVDKLNEEAANFCRPEASDVHATGSSGQSRTSFRENGSSHDEAGCSDASKAKSDTDLKRKQSEVVAESQNQNKSPKTEGGQQLSPNSSKASFKQPKREKLDWSVLRPKSQSNQKKRG